MNNKKTMGADKPVNKQSKYNANTTTMMHNVARQTTQHYNDDNTNVIQSSVSLNNRTTTQAEQWQFTHYT